MIFSVLGGDDRSCRLCRLLRADGHTVRAFALERGLPDSLPDAAAAVGGADCVLLPGFDAAVLACGHCGFGMGATPNAIANMDTFTGANGPSPKAFFVVPIVGSLFIDFVHAIIITVFIKAIV